MRNYWEWRELLLFGGAAAGLGACEAPVAGEGLAGWAGDSASESCGRLALRP